MYVDIENRGGVSDSRNMMANQIMCSIRAMPQKSNVVTKLAMEKSSTRN